jgi:hypothetical protein
VIGAGAAPTPPIVSPTNLTINGRVSALELSAGRLFVGGQMTAPFQRLGAIDPASGAVVWSAPGIPSQVNALAVAGGTLFVGGDFGLRAFSTTTGAQLASITCGRVLALDVHPAGTSVVAGGNFSTCGGLNRRNLALVNVGTLAVDASWRPPANAAVLALAADDSGVFVGGRFSSIGSASRYRLGKVTWDGEVHAWSSTYDPPSGAGGTTKSVRAMDVVAGRVVASWGESVNKTVVYDQSSAAFIRFWGHDGDTQVVYGRDGNIYLGGHWYRFVGPSPSVYFAAFDAVSFRKETVVSDIPFSPMGIFAIISDGAGGLWLGGDVNSTWGPDAVRVKRLVHLVPGGTPPPTTTTTSTTTTTTTVPGSTTTTTTTTTTLPPPTTTTAPPGGGDTQEPDSQVSAPVARSTVASPFTFAGTATDDTGVDRVRMAVRDSVTLQWLQANGTFGPTFAQVDATVADRGATSTGWTWTRSLPPGSYFVQSRAVDITGRSETAMPWVAFTVG